MELLAFRITNFRSIQDTKWVSFSPDGVTVLVGQNESGKTSVLEALAAALNPEPISEDDVRIGADPPEISLRVKVAIDDIEEELSSESAELRTALTNYLQKKTNEITLVFGWEVKNSKYSGTIELASPDAALEEVVAAILPTVENEDQDARRLRHEKVYAKLGRIFYGALPEAVLFNAESGLLPNTVDLSEAGEPTGPGAEAAKNFITIADIDMGALIKGDGRYRTNILNRANDRVSQDFTRFWTQIIGKTSKLEIRCDIQHYPASKPDKAGKEHLVFWISDGSTQLYPKQRSLGVRWFVSFYLQMRASEASGSSRIFLLDEPGANLHARAQGDVLRLVDELRKEIPVVYSTHAPKMIEYEKLFRVRAVQRDGEKEDSPTILMDALHLGTASTDTLSPILMAMGADMSAQSVIQHKRNVLIEEMSGYFYLRSFWHLTQTKAPVYFIAATGVNKIPALANMFIGWGLDFIVAVDDDKQGREVYKELKRELFGDEISIASKKLLKLPSGSSIEDAFNNTDFSKFVLQQDIIISGSNGDFLKNQQISKPVTAYRFWMRVSEGEILWDQLHEESRTRISAVVTAIVNMLGG